MTSDVDINDTKTVTLKKGDTVVMHTCIEASLPEYNGKIWTCLSDSYLDKCQNEVVFLEGFSGCFFVEYLQIVNVQHISNPNESESSNVLTTEANRDDLLIRFYQFLEKSCMIKGDFDVNEVVKFFK